MLEVLLGPDGKRKIRLRRMTNAELFSLYESDLKLKHSSQAAREESQRVLGYFKNFLGQFPPTPELATSFLATFTDRKPTTLYRYHSIIKSFMAWYGDPIFSKIRLPQTLPDYIETADIEKLKTAMRSKKTHKKVIERNLLIIDLGLKAGLRRAEISSLLINDIDLSRNYLIVRLGKGMQDRIVDLTPILAKELQQFTKGKSPDEKLFRLSPSTISGIVRWAAKKAGIKIHTHSLRHFFGQDLVDHGADIETVRRLMGHKSLKSTQVYLGRSDTQRKQAIARLEGPANTEPTEVAGLPTKLVNDVTMAKKLQEDEVYFSPEKILDAIRLTAKELQAFAVDLGGIEDNVAGLLQKCWQEFERGVSKSELTETLTKMYPSLKLRQEYYFTANALIEQLSRWRIIQSQHWTEIDATGQRDVTRWVLTGEGREMVRFLPGA